jgi:hypothetical protein
VVYVASSRRSRGSEAKDDRFDDIECGAMEVGSNYPSLDVIFVLAHRGILVFCCGLVIWPTKSPRRFFGLVLKLSGRRFVSLRLKTNERMKTV